MLIVDRLVRNAQAPVEQIVFLIVEEPFERSPRAGTAFNRIMCTAPVSTSVGYHSSRIRCGVFASHGTYGCHV